MAFAIRRPTPPPLMAKFPDIFLPHSFSFAIEFYTYETDFTLGPNKNITLRPLTLVQNFKHNVYILVTCTTTTAPNKLLRSVLLITQ